MGVFENIFSILRCMTEVKYIEITEGPRLWSEFLRYDATCQITEIYSEVYKVWNK